MTDTETFDKLESLHGEINDAVVGMETDGAGEDVLDAMERALRKFLRVCEPSGYSSLSDICARLLDVRGGISSGAIECEPEVIDLCFSALDALKMAVNRLKAGKRDRPDHNVLDELAELTGSSTDGRENETPGDRLEDAGRDAAPADAADDEAAESPETGNEQFLEIFREETGVHIETINDAIMDIENGDGDTDTVEGILRAAHSIKGTSNIAGFPGISEIAHIVEEVFDQTPINEIENNPGIIDALFESTDTIKMMYNRAVDGRSEGSGRDVVAQLKEILAAREGAGEAAGEPGVPARTQDAQPSPASPPPDDEPAGESHGDSSDGPSAIPEAAADPRMMSYFVEETEDHLESLSNGVLAIENGEWDSGTIDELMRAAHSIKGASATMGFNSMNCVAHAVEDVFRAIGSGDIEAGSEIADVIFEGIDCIEKLFAAASGGEPEFDVADICDKIKSNLHGGAREEPSKTPAPEQQAPQQPSSLPEQTADIIKAAHPDPQAGGPAPGPPPRTAADAPPVKKTVIDEHIKVNVSRLDNLMNYIEELILIKRQTEEQEKKLRANAATIKNLRMHWKALQKKLPGDNETRSMLREMDRLIIDSESETKTVAKAGKDVNSHRDIVMKGLQQEVMEMRMLPLSTIFGSYPRAVRDLARQCGKKVRLSVSGRDTRLDKSIIEEISDPMIHIIRNAVDHGIETPAERTASGKDETGLLSITASQAGDHVEIRIADDGRGIDTDRVREKAVERGLVSEENCRALSDREAVQFIMEPGFSTADAVTQVSGRGVGMDVVKKSIEDAKGNVAIETKHGSGTTFIMELPLALAITRMLLVESAGETFGLPTTSVRETLQVAPDSLKNVMDRDVIRVAGESIPVAVLSTLLGLEGRDAFPQQEMYPVVVVGAGDEKIGVIVDEILDEQETVLKTLGEHLKNTRTVGGATILGNGEIVIILKPPHLFEVAKEIPGSRNVSETAVSQHKKVDRKKILIVEDVFNIREIEKLVLESTGYEVETATDGMAAYRKAMASDYDMVITDIIMPKMDGVELTEKLRASRRYRETPIIILTSAENDRDRKRGIDAGADMYLKKSEFNRKRLLEIVGRMIA